MSKILHYLVICFFLLLSFTTFSQAVKLSSSKLYIPIAAGSYLIDHSGKLNLADFTSESKKFTFLELDSAHDNILKSSKVFWIKSSFINTDDFDNEWILDFQGWSKVNFYYKDDSSKWIEKITGHLIPYRKRDHPIGNRSLIRVPLKAQTTIPFYVRLESLPDNLLAPKNLNFTASLRSHLEREAHIDELIVSTFIGICIALFFYNLFIFSATRELSTLFYLGHLFALSYVVSNNSGYLISALKFVENFPSWRAPLEALMSGCNFFFICLFTMHFLQTKNYLPQWHKALTIITIFLVLQTIAAITKFELFGKIIWFIAYIDIFFLVSLGIKSVLSKVPSSGYYMLAYGFTFLGTIILTSAFLGILPINHIFIRNSTLAGYGLEIIFFSFAIGNKINTLQIETKAQQKVIINNFEERAQMQQNIAKDLEKKVEERTHEINEQKEIIQAEREKSQILLLNIFPKHVVDELINSGKYQPRYHPTVTVMFTDFKGFTNTVSTIPPDKLVSELNDLFHHFDDIIIKCGLEKIKTIGDAYMAACGLSDDNPDHAVQCVTAAKQILEYLHKRNLSSAIKWEIRIGLHSGSVVAGVVGKNKFTFDLWGDTVNIASRIESACEIGYINASAYTFDLVQTKFSGQYRGKIDIKGKGEIDMYYIS